MPDKDETAGIMLSALRRARFAMEFTVERDPGTAGASECKIALPDVRAAIKRAEREGVA